MEKALSMKNNIFYEGDGDQRGEREDAWDWRGRCGDVDAYIDVCMCIYIYEFMYIYTHI